MTVEVARPTPRRPAPWSNVSTAWATTTSAARCTASCASAASVRPSCSSTNKLGCAGWRAPLDRDGLKTTCAARRQEPGRAPEGAGCVQEGRGRSAGVHRRRRARPGHQGRAGRFNFDIRSTPRTTSTASAAPAGGRPALAVSFVSAVDGPATADIETAQGQDRDRAVEFSGGGQRRPPGPHQRVAAVTPAAGPMPRWRRAAAPRGPPPRARNGMSACSACERYPITPAGENDPFDKALRGLRRTGLGAGRRAQCAASRPTSSHAPRGRAVQGRGTARRRPRPTA